MLQVMGAEVRDSCDARQCAHEENQVIVICINESLPLYLWLDALPGHNITVPVVFTHKFIVQDLPFGCAQRCFVSLKKDSDHFFRFYCAALLGCGTRDEFVSFSLVTAVLKQSCQPQTPHQTSFHHTHQISQVHAVPRTT
jgi:hypothetical protein